MNINDSPTQKHPFCLLPPPPPDCTIWALSTYFPPHFSHLLLHSTHYLLFPSLETFQGSVVTPGRYLTPEHSELEGQIRKMEHLYFRIWVASKYFLLSTLYLLISWFHFSLQPNNLIKLKINHSLAYAQ